MFDEAADHFSRIATRRIIRLAVAQFGKLLKAGCLDWQDLCLPSTVGIGTCCDGTDQPRVGEVDAAVRCGGVIVLAEGTSAIGVWRRAVSADLQQDGIKCLANARTRAALLNLITS